MPIFEYKCARCGEICEFLERNSKDNLHKCPKCGSSGLDKQFSSFAAVVKEPQPESKCNSCPSGRTCPNAGMQR